MLGNEISCVVKMEDSACVRKHVLNVFDVFNKKFYDVFRHKDSTYIDLHLYAPIST